MVADIFNKVCFWTKQHAPEILIGVGMTAGAAGTALACVATTKVNSIVEETKKELNDIKEEENELTDPKKERAMVYVKAAGKLAANYAPAIGLSIVSAGCILYGAGILNKRNTALSLGLAAATNTFKEYRKEVINRYGEDVDKQIRYGLKSVEIKTKETGEDGKPKTVKKNINVLEDYDQISPLDYSRVFDWCNPYWDSDMNTNRFFINSQQYLYNNKLRADGHVFLNDVLKSLGFPTTRVGQEVGWVYDPNNSCGDNFIDFGMYEACVDVEGYRKVLMLDFNVDGSILNKVDWPDQKVKAIEKEIHNG